MRTGKTLVCARILTFFLLTMPAPLLAQEIETSVDAPSVKTGRPASSETPSFTFRKRRVRVDSDARLQAILERIKRHQHYPGIARESGAQGAATVSFQILPDGRLHDLRVKNTSGNAFLDDASLEAVRKAAPLPYLDKTLVLTIRYTLTRTTDQP